MKPINSGGAPPSGTSEAGTTGQSPPQNPFKLPGADGNPTVHKDTFHGLSPRSLKPADGTPTDKRTGVAGGTGAGTETPTFPSSPIKQSGDTCLGSMVALPREQEDDLLSASQTASARSRTPAEKLDLQLHEKNRMQSQPDPQTSLSDIIAQIRTFDAGNQAEALHRSLRQQWIMSASKRHEMIMALTQQIPKLEESVRFIAVKAILIALDPEDDSRAVPDDRQAVQETQVEAILALSTMSPDLPAAKRLRYLERMLDTLDALDKSGCLDESKRQRKNLDWDRSFVCANLMRNICHLPAKDQHDVFVRVATAIMAKGTLETHAFRVSKVLKNLEKLEPEVAERARGTLSELKLLDV